MTYGAPFPRVQFQFQVGASGSPQAAARPHDLCGTDDGPMEALALSLRRCSQDSIRRSRSTLFAAQFLAKYATSKL